MRRITVVLTALAITIIGLATFSPAQAVADRDCGDFDNQAQAQRFFIDQGGPNNDPHRLDADGDGKACDSLPCPCSSSTSGGDSSTGGSTGSTTLRQAARVTKIIDGDTVRVRLRSGATKDVRMIGIDTPEVYGGTECGGPAASRYLKRILPVGAIVTLVSDPTQALKDRYGRLLRYVIYKKRDMNRAQVWSGNAKVYVYNNDPFKRVKSYRNAQASAKANNRGSWRTCW
jgi:endonuclease YncB( thermonuclease family)